MAGEYQGFGRKSDSMFRVLICCHVPVNHNTNINLEAFTATEFNKIFSDRQPRQGGKVFQCFRDWLRPHLQGTADGLVKPKLMNRCPTLFAFIPRPVRTEIYTRNSMAPIRLFWFYQAPTELVPETLQNFHTFTRLSALEDFIAQYKFSSPYNYKILYMNDKDLSFLICYCNLFMFSLLNWGGCYRHSRSHGLRNIDVNE